MGRLQRLARPHASGPLHHRGGPCLHRAAAAVGVREIWERDDGCLDFVCAGGSVVRVGVGEVMDLIPERGPLPFATIDPEAMGLIGEWEGGSDARHDGDGRGV